jgi:thymidylate kinase
MSAHRRIVALEGPCCAGKTTLGHALLNELPEYTPSLVACYADHAGGGRYLPPQEASTVREREDALWRLLDIEAGRFAAIPPGSRLVIADRSVHTLLGNSLALQDATGIGFFEPAARLLNASAVPTWPDLVLYLDLPQPLVCVRNNDKFPPGSIYIDAAFNASVRAYFRRLANQKAVHVAWLDATLDPAELIGQASGQIRHMMSCRIAGN